MNKKSKTISSVTGIKSVTLAAALLTGQSVHGQSDAADWKDHTISPVANPIYFEDPQIDSEARPVFMDHRLPETFHFQGGTAPLGGDMKIFAAQLRYALT